MVRLLKLKLSEVLTAHDLSSHPHALPHNLGDAFLLNHNPVIATIRALAIEAKFKFVSTRWSQYDALPLVELPRVLKKRTIPYTDNVGVLRELEKLNPNFHQFKKLPPLKMNPIFHESAHAVAHVLSGLGVSHQRLKTLKEERFFALKVLLQESFANATESFANVYSDTELHNEFFYLNSYVIEKTVHRVAIVKLVQAIGKESAFQVLMLSFLHANFLKIDQVDASLKRVLSFLDLEGIKSRDKALVKKVFLIGLNLDPEFTEETNAFCLAHLGVKTELQKLFAFDFLVLLKKEPKLKLAFDRFSNVAIGF